MPKASKPLSNKPDDVAKRRKSIVNAVMDGASPREAVLAAGYSEKTLPTGVMKSDDVREALMRARKELGDTVNIKRGDVIAGILDAIELAKIAADPASMIRGYSEIGKMLGFYAPEVKKVEITTSQAALISKYEVMSDAELLAKLEEKTIEGDFTRMN